MHLKDKVVWITGASSGIGEALAIELAKHQAKLILSGRNTDALQLVTNNCSQYTSSIEILPFDLEDIDNFPSIAKTAISFYHRIDILINNGGISQRSDATETPLEIDRKIMEVNYFGNIALTKNLLPHFIKNKAGHVVVISSLSGKFGWRQRSAYAASKFALHGFYESMRAELFDKNISVLMVCPARVKTNISLHAITKDGSESNTMDEAQQKGIDADVCARKIIKAILSGRKEIFITRFEIVLLYIRRIFPSLYYKIAAKRDPNK